MKAVPMIFNTEMVKALLDGRKSVTRRPMKPQPEASGRGYDWWPSKVHQTMINLDKVKGDLFWDGVASDACPIASIGDLIYVRETFCPDPDCDHDSWDDHVLSFFEWNNCGCSAAFIPDVLKTNEHCLFKAGGFPDLKWTPSIHMPRWASRITLKVTDVRIEQVQDITEAQAKQEGIRYHSIYNEWGGVEAHPDSRHHAPQWRWYKKATDAFKCLWNSVYSNWDENPYVWVIEFEVIHKNVDAVLAEVSA